MADRWYNVALGGKVPADVAEGGSDTSLYAAFRVTYTATGNGKQETINALEAVRDYLANVDTWPPA